MFTKATEYAIKAMLFLALQQKSEGKINLNDIAAAIESPTAFTAKILQQLRRSNLLVSTIGVKGGFRIPDSRRISLKEIVLAIEGDAIFKHCGLGLKACSSENPCPIHVHFSKLKGDLENMLAESFLDDYVDALKTNSLTLK